MSYYNSQEQFDILNANLWWTKYFELMLFQLLFFQHGLFVKEQFAHWTEWRRFEYEGERPHNMETGGVSYREGWKYYKTIPAISGSPLIEFLDEVHGAKNSKQVRRIVKSASKPWRWRLHRRRAAIGRNLWATFRSKSTET